MSSGQNNNNLRNHLLVVMSGLLIINLILLFLPSWSTLNESSELTELSEPSQSSNHEPELVTLPLMPVPVSENSVTELQLPSTEFKEQIDLGNLPGETPVFKLIGETEQLEVTAEEFKLFCEIFHPTDFNFNNLSRKEFQFLAGSYRIVFCIDKYFQNQAFFNDRALIVSLELLKQSMISAVYIEDFLDEMARVHPVEEITIDQTEITQRVEALIDDFSSKLQLKYNDELSFTEIENLIKSSTRLDEHLDSILYFSNAGDISLFEFYQFCELLPMLSRYEMDASELLDEFAKLKILYYGIPLDERKNLEQRLKYNLLKPRIGRMKRKLSELQQAEIELDSDDDAKLYQHYLTNSEDYTVPESRIFIRYDFETIFAAENFSISEEVTENQADRQIGPVEFEHLPLELATELFSLEFESLSKPLESENGFNRFYLIDINPARLLPFEDVKTLISREHLLKLELQTFDDFVNQLISDTELKLMI